MWVETGYFVGLFLLDIEMRREILSDEESFWTNF